MGEAAEKRVQERERERERRQEEHDAYSIMKGICTECQSQILQKSSDAYTLNHVSGLQLQESKKSKESHRH